MLSGNCAICGTFRPWLHSHHLVARILGGTDSDGLSYICANCHEDVHGGPCGGVHRGRSSNSPESIAKKSKTMKRLWRDDDYREKMKRRRSRPSRRPDKSVLERMYLTEHMTQTQIAEHFGVAQANISMWMHDLGIVPRANGAPRKPRPEREELRHLYQDERLSSHALAERYDVTPVTVRNWLRAYEIPILAPGGRRKEVAS